MIAISQTLYLESNVSAFSSTFHLSCLSSSHETGTGIFHAHRNHVTFGVFLTIYQLSFVTTISTNIYQGRIFFFFFTFSQDAFTDTIS